MIKKYLIALYSDVIDSTFSKMFFNKQWTQHEYDILTECANTNTAVNDMTELKDKAKELLDLESKYCFRHCKNVSRQTK